MGKTKMWPGSSAYVVVVAAVDGTVVEITPNTPIAAGGGIPQGIPGVPFQVAMDEGDLLQLAVYYVDDDLNGTLITSQPDHPVGVISGNTAVNIPWWTNAADHLQHQLLGLQMWGNRFVASRVAVRSGTSSVEKSAWQIMASQDNTTVQLTAHADVTGLSSVPLTLNRGEVYEALVGGTVANPGDFLVEADKPIAVVNYMTGGASVPDNYLGDPSMVQLSSVEQFLDRYEILIPPYWQVDVATITRRTGAQVLIDGLPVDNGLFIPVGPQFEVARVVLPDGVHLLEGSGGIAVIVSGYESGSSYAYLGGAGTRPINPID
jgi:hypothetical protein